MTQDFTRCLCACLFQLQGKDVDDSQVLDLTETKADDEKPAEEPKAEVS